ncbi:hypothetical protein D3C85_1302710 [compost metagenome]
MEAGASMQRGIKPLDAISDLLPFHRSLYEYSRRHWLQSYQRFDVFELIRVFLHPDDSGIGP